MSAADNGHLSNGAALALAAAEVPEAEPTGAAVAGTVRERTIWGLDAEGLLERFWAARGVQLVRRGEGELIQESAELYLLVEPWVMPVFSLDSMLDTLQWLKPRLLLARIHDREEHGYSERVVTDGDDRFVRFERDYGQSAATRVTRAALTSDAELARAWRRMDHGASAWRWLRGEVGVVDRATVSVHGTVYAREEIEERVRLVRELVRTWSRPDVSIPMARRWESKSRVWFDGDSSEVGRETRFIGPVWVGSGRKVSGEASVVGPTVLWDAEAARPAVEALDWGAMSAASLGVRELKRTRASSVSRIAKRAFDIAFASAAILMTAPIYPLVMLAILIEDGRPFFFAHHRETRGGVTFPCLKFRSMRKDAEEIKKKMMEENQVDGPQFFIEHDPRHTRVGRFIRKTQIDELPQFFNVLVGQMSIVGPRPSPFSENQYAPAWRDARLSVRPGITGLWQVMRTREKDIDFQEWIRYDLEYVENVSMALDLKIIAWTVMQMVGLKKKAEGPGEEAGAGEEPQGDGGARG